MTRVLIFSLGLLLACSVSMGCDGKDNSSGLPDNPAPKPDKPPTAGGGGSKAKTKDKKSEDKSKQSE